MLLSNDKFGLIFPSMITKRINSGTSTGFSNAQFIFENDVLVFKFYLVTFAVYKKEGDEMKMSFLS